MARIPQPFMAGLVVLHHRLAAEKSAANARRISAVHAASLRASGRPARDGASQAEGPWVATPEAFTNRSPVSEAHGGRSTQDA